MARSLILVPAFRMVGATAIDERYPRSYTPDDMRRWAADLHRALAVDPTELDAWRALSPDERSPEQAGAVQAHDRFLGDPADGIKGSLREDGRVDLDGGRHRAHYIADRADALVPIWVSAPSARSLDDFAADCRSHTALDAPSREQRARERTRSRGR